MCVPSATWITRRNTNSKHRQAQQISFMVLLSVSVHMQSCFLVVLFILHPSWLIGDTKHRPKKKIRESKEWKRGGGEKKRVSWLMPFDSISSVWRHFRAPGASVSSQEQRREKDGDRRGRRGWGVLWCSLIWDVRFHDEESWCSTYTPTRGGSKEGKVYLQTCCIPTTNTHIQSLRGKRLLIEQHA